jgi:hypothetical protein
MAGSGTAFYKHIRFLFERFPLLSNPVYSVIFLKTDWSFMLRVGSMMGAQNNIKLFFVSLLV